MDPLTTPDGRYLVVRGGLWRTVNLGLGEQEEQRLVNELMDARLLPLPDLMAVKMTFTPERGTNEEEELTHGRPKAKWTLSPRHRGAQSE